MALKTIALFLGLILACIAASGTSARDLFINPEARVETSNNLVDCWNALLEIKSCSNEIVLFFLNGTADIGPECCRSIAIITRKCWPAMLTTLGFTAEEGNILRGYCDAASYSPTAAPPLAAASPLQYNPLVN
ncbi:hypothetical protein P3X46_012935 [Hevea brasiliensis]|uniref:Prolamin-like domain-containing protein n=1 Tax=Hevea brasiliensis TaxID=3981 RepID=A0ABQ9MFE0_HEVBR|nr:egg cell-secreted protein 1.4-like [Hevea brasiliensis]KAJ9177756.1 hypothetical protein P3X46_012935 [Hevea brasiliensis]